MAQLIRINDRQVLLTKLVLARTFRARLVGLQFRSELPLDTGLLLEPCKSLHTCFMRFPIDVIMLDRNYVVLGVRREIRPWRALICVPGTHAVVETAQNTVSVSLGERLAVRE
jgi:uncharacterized protein